MMLTDVVRRMDERGRESWFKAFHYWDFAARKYGFRSMDLDRQLSVGRDNGVRVYGIQLGAR